VHRQLLRPRQDLSVVDAGSVSKRSQNWVSTVAMVATVRGR